MRFGSAIAAVGLLLACAGQLGAADLAAGAVESAPATQEEKGIWAAIAYSSIDEKHGFFWGADKRQEAVDTALEHCQRAGGNDCVVVTVFRNHRHWDDDDHTGFPYEHCGALALGEETTGRPTSWGAESAQTRREAEEMALQICERTGETCKIREWVCT